MPSYINLSEEQVDIKWRQMAADYLVAERETLEPERGGKKERCEKDEGGKRTNQEHAQSMAQKSSQQRGQQPKHFMGG